MARRTQADRNLERAQRIAGNLRGLYARARREHWSHARLIVELGPEKSRAAGLTQYWHGYIQGTCDTEAAAIWRDCVIWRLGTEAGPLEPETGPGSPGADRGWTPGPDGTPGPLSALAGTPGALFGAHFWRGTAIAFTPYEVTNRPLVGQEGGQA